ncbi:hypothetical protein [Bradyrhizobium sp. NAS80.1]|uniref:hypothetical protein n=1 Tax=Bradyrhizobium sp. NAS80.1 TaxID=1680159 RepID=UPI000A8648EE|nr:hypothetical protein [Bradyrhizobium sp. NAS80.1]
MLDLHGISRAAFDLVVAEEVTGEAYYNRHYRGLEYPGDQSGPTGGIGYDFGTQRAAQIEADWRGRVSDIELNILRGAAGVRGDKAAAYVRRYGHAVDISFATAIDVFAGRDLPRYLAILERYCPGAGSLGPDCKGVLFSIALNRDAAGFVKGGPRYAEMREIRACVASGDLARIPGLIRSIKRLWAPTNGVYKRREHEAVLFEHGLATHHPDQTCEARGGAAGARSQCRGAAANPPARARLFRCRRDRRQLVPKGRTEAAGDPSASLNSDARERLARTRDALKVANDRIKEGRAWHEGVRQTYGSEGAK